MASPLFDMLSDLAKDPAALERFIASPQEVMSEYGIASETQELIRSSMEQNRHHDFYKAIGDEAAEHFRPDPRGFFVLC